MEKSFFANRDDRCGLAVTLKVGRQRAERTSETSNFFEKRQKRKLLRMVRGGWRKSLGRIAATVVA